MGSSGLAGWFASRIDVMRAAVRHGITDTPVARLRQGQLHVQITSDIHDG
ncbi:hypothetical protein E2C01_045465 [Portunus trituberculatus]|uniref:Uncharacterized protein n=1 Tax=Portunus trituberculatus TaxID=210409 RepID=A0A5B7G1A4_PORTR|nr:hypothetical protein [Portunus trituberculatus]